jgi:hypothetical protein
LIARLDMAGCRDWGYSLKGVLELHRKEAKRRYEEGFEAGARACGPMCTRTGELKAAELALQIFEAGKRMEVVAERLEAIIKGEAP